MGILALHSRVWITVGPILVINILFLTSMLFFFLKRKNLKREIPESATRTKSAFLGVFLKEWWVFITDPIALFFVKIGLRPSTITGIGFLFSVAAGFLFAKGFFGYAGWIMIFSATFDIFDGRVARLTNQESRSGAFLDAVMDRFGEGACFLGLAFYFRSSWILFFVITGLIGSTLVSYTRAKGEGAQIDCKKGYMQRAERITYLGVASILEPVSATLIANPFPVFVVFSLILIAIMTNVTAVQRMIFIMNALDTNDKSKRETLPQLLTKLSTHKGREDFFKKSKYGYDRSRASSKHILLFCLDGKYSNLLNKLIQEKKLSNIQKYIINKGGKYTAITSFPSTTGPGFTPFVTGCFPGTCDVPGVRWFDRDVPSAKILTLNRFRDYLGWGAYAFDHDLSPSVKTIYEYSKKAVNIFGMVNRGCGLIRDPSFFRLHSLYKTRKKIPSEELEKAAFEWFLHALRKRSDFIFYYYPGFEYQKENDLTEALIRFDNIVGNACDELKQEGIFKDSAIFITTDYSTGKCEQSIDLAELISKKIPTLNYPEKIREFNHINAISLLSGTSSANVYLKRGTSWQNRYYFDEIEQTNLPEYLLQSQAIDVIAGKLSNGTVTVLNKQGKATILEKEGHIIYDTIAGNPLGIEGKEIEYAKTLDITKNTSCPDSLMQILQIFKSGRSGDLIISANKGYSFDKNQNTITHGSINKEHTSVPFLSNISLNKEVFRTADVFSLTMNLLGAPIDHNVDGISI